MRILGLAAFGALFATPAAAQFLQIDDLVPNAGIAGNGLVFVFFVGAFSFAMWSATWLIRERRALDDSRRALGLELADLKARHERAQALLEAPDQRVVVWDDMEQAPTCRGSLPVDTGAPAAAADFVAFGQWTKPRSAQLLDHAIQRLRLHAETFEMPVETREGAVLEAQGRASGAFAFVRFIPLSGDRAALALLEAQHQNLMVTTDTLRKLLEAAPLPVWLRGHDQSLTWANPAYCRALDSDTLKQAVESDHHLLDEGDRSRAHTQLRETEATSFHQRLQVTVAGDRRTMDTTLIEHGGGHAGIAVDMSEVEQVQSDLRRTLHSHAQTMDQLATAVAIFDPAERLIFHNQAFQNLWALDAGFLDSAPSAAALFNELRDRDRIANQPDWTKWRGELLAVHSATEPAEHFWHLPDGRSLRVIANPHRQGGVTWVFENITEQLEMESRYIALTKVQGETLDHLGEAIAVFAPDGRLKLSNPSFQSLWELEDEQVAADTPITEIARQCRIAVDGEEVNATSGALTVSNDTPSAAVWRDLVTGVTGVSDARASQNGRLDLSADKVLDYALVPLPNGQTLLSFADVTASVNLEHTLQERNEALESGQRLKNDFLTHVSYEFRAPLQNIKGFSEILEGGAFGPMNARQAEYVGHISASAKVLHTLVDNLLDLATMSAGHMEVNHQPLQLGQVFGRARDAAHAIAAERELDIAMEIGDDVTFAGDGDQVHKILENLLGNAARFSPRGSTIRLSGEVSGGWVHLRVSDEGPGIPEDIRDTIFERFTARATRSNKRGAGLGLAVARALAQLHGGTLDLDAESDVTSGATFICCLPINAAASAPLMLDATE